METASARDPPGVGVERDWLATYVRGELVTSMLWVRAGTVRVVEMAAVDGGQFVKACVVAAYACWARSFRATLFSFSTFIRLAS